MIFLEKNLKFIDFYYFYKKNRDEIENVEKKKLPE